MDADIGADLFHHFRWEPPGFVLSRMKSRQEKRNLVRIAWLEPRHLFVEFLRKDLVCHGSKTPYRSSSPAMMLMLPKAATMSPISSPLTIGLSPWKWNTDGPRMR